MTMTLAGAVTFTAFQAIVAELGGTKLFFATASGRILQAGVFANSIPAVIWTPDPRTVTPPTVVEFVAVYQNAVNLGDGASIS